MQLPERAGDNVSERVELGVDDELPQATKNTTATTYFILTEKKQGDE
jgi:hypothetical protein